MKICLINNLYKPYNRGGAERVVELIARGLINAGHDVFIISTRPIKKISNIQYPPAAYPWLCPASAGKRTAGQAISNIQYIPALYYNLNKFPKLFRIFWHIIDMFDIGGYFKIKLILRKEKPDIVMTHNLKGISYLIPVLIKKLNIKHIHTLHDIQLLHPSGLMLCGKEKIIDSPPAKIYSGICRQLFNSPNIVVSPSSWLMETHLSRGFFRNSKQAVLPNPISSCHSRESGNPGVNGKNVDNRSKIINIPTALTWIPNPRPRTPGCVPLPRASAQRGRQVGNDKIRRFLYVGQIENHKGVLFLISVFKKFNAGLNYELIIIGGGGKLKQAKELAGDNKNISVLGKINNEDVQKLMSRSDVLIAPSLCYENSPAVIYEAFSHGLPVIASDIGGIPELLADNAGLLFKPGDEEDLINKMKWAISNPEKLKKTGEKGGEKIKQFGVERYIDKLLNIISRI